MRHVKSQLDNSEKRRKDYLHVTSNDYTTQSLLLMYPRIRGVVKGGRSDRVIIPRMESAVSSLFCC